MKQSIAYNEEQVSNDGAFSLLNPYIAEVELTGSSPILFHRWSCDDVETKANAAKNSKVKKTDNIESYLYRNEQGEICVPGEYVRQSVIGAAKYRQDPRSPRKTACDLFKASLIALTELASTGVKEADYLDRRRVCIQRSGITRIRPALNAGWQARFQFMVQVPEYITPAFFHEILTDAGKLVGIGDFRPTYGRFQISHFEVLTK